MTSSLTLEYVFPGCNVSPQLSYSALSCHRISKFPMSKKQKEISLLLFCFIPGVLAEK